MLIAGTLSVGLVAWRGGSGACSELRAVAFLRCNASTTPTQRIVFGELVAEHPAPVTLDELARIVPRIAAEDAAPALCLYGLAHREGDAVWASRAVVRGDQLSL